MAELAALTLATICLDVQIRIACIWHCVRYVDIIAQISQVLLSRLVKLFIVARQRVVVWVASALRQVCLGNTYPT